LVSFASLTGNLMASNKTSARESIDHRLFIGAVIVHLLIYWALFFIIDDLSSSSTADKHQYALTCLHKAYAVFEFPILTYVKISNPDYNPFVLTTHSISYPFGEPWIFKWIFINSLCAGTVVGLVLQLFKMIRLRLFG
jgi:hypothetical protein